MIDYNSIINNIISSVVFTVLSVLLIYLFRHRLNRNLRIYFISTFKKAIGEKSYEEIDLELAINNVANSLKRTRVFFFRIGNFYIKKQEYNKVVSFAIDEELIWDYHVHLSSSLSNNIDFLRDFYEIENNKAIKVNQVNTTHLLEISRNEFIISVSDILREYHIDKSFVDIVIQGVISGTDKYPRLNELNISKLNISSIVVFFTDKALKISQSSMDGFAQKLIAKTKDFETKSLYIGEECLSENDISALNFGNEIIKHNS